MIFSNPYLTNLKEQASEEDDDVTTFIGEFQLSRA